MCSQDISKIDTDLHLKKNHSEYVAKHWDQCEKCGDFFKTYKKCSCDKKCSQDISTIEPLEHFKISNSDYLTKHSNQCEKCGDFLKTEMKCGCDRNTQNNLLLQTGESGRPLSKTSYDLDLDDLDSKLHWLNNDTSKTKDSARPYLCITCWKSFSEKFDLEVHKRSHKNETNESISEPESESSDTKQSLRHKCSICNKGFKDRYSVNVHVRTHTGSKPYKCATCGKCFRQKAHLEKHHKIHNKCF